MSDHERIVQVRIAPRQTATRDYIAVTAIVGDLHLSCDLTDDRQIRLAKRLADSHGATFLYHEDVADRVRAALGEATA